jgi:CRISP-associated protein Cas1
LQVKEYIASLLGDVEYYRPLALKFHPESEVKSQKLKVKRENKEEGRELPKLLLAVNNNSSKD